MVHWGCVIARRIFLRHHHPVAAWRWRENLRPKDALLGRGQEASGEPIFEPSHDLSLLLLLGLVLAVRDETHLD